MPELNSKLVEALQEASKEGKISCTAARKIAEDLQLPVRQVGEAADQLKIRIKACELGCF